MTGSRRKLARELLASAEYAGEWDLRGFLTEALDAIERALAVEHVHSAIFHPACPACAMRKELER